MSKKLIVANWKMNLLGEEAGRLTREIIKSLETVKSDLEIVLAPPFVSLDVVGNLIRDTHIELGAQNVFWEKLGAFTGEISTSMLEDLGCKWVVVGHSERRHILNEDDQMISKKVEAVINSKMNCILCVGETLEEREKGKTTKFVEGQLLSVLTELEIVDLSKLTVAYEPVWAIGTGKNAAANEVEYVHSFIRDILNGVFKNSDDIRIIYGGSVTAENLGDIMSAEFVDGSLIGGASLNSESFLKLVKIAGD